MTKYISEIVDEAIKSETEEDAVAVLRENNRPQLRNILQFAVIPKSKKRTFEQVEYTPDGAPIGMNPTNLYKTERQLYLFKAGTTTPVDHLNRVLIQLLEGMCEEECKTFLATINGTLLTGNLNKSVIKQAFPEIVFDESIDSSDNEEHEQKTAAAKDREIANLKRIHGWEEGADDAEIDNAKREIGKRIDDAEKEEISTEEAPKKRGPGRPPGAKNKKKTKITKNAKRKITPKKKDVADVAGRPSNSTTNHTDSPTGRSVAGEQSQQTEEATETPPSKVANRPASSTAGLG